MRRAIRRLLGSRRGNLAAAFVVALALAGGALAYYTTTGSGVGTASVGAFTAATISAPATSGASITITWTSQASLSDSSHNGGINYTVQRKLGSGGTYATLSSGGCGGSLPYNTLSCADTVSANGNYYYEVVAHYGGNAWTATSNEVTVAATVDNTPPTTTVSFPSNGGSYNAAGWTAGCNASPFFVTNAICGAASDPSGVANVKVAIENSTSQYWNGSSFVASGSPIFNTAGGTTSWSYAFTPPLNDTFTVLVQATDGVGNTTAPGAETTASFLYDTVAPTVTLNNFTNNATNTTTPTFSGTAGNQAADSSHSADSASVVLSICTGSQTSCNSGSGSFVESVTATRSGTSWSVAASPALTTNATYTAQAAQPDGVGNTGTSSVATFIVDTAAPSSTLTFPTTSGPFNATSWNAGASSKIAGTASDPGPSSGLANVKISIQKVSGNYWNGSSFGSAGEQLITAGGSSSWTLAFAASNFATTGGGDGSYTVRVYATDNAGNTQAVATSQTFTYDNTAPTASVTFPAASGIYNASGWTNGGTTPCSTSGTICGQATDATSGISGASSITLTITRSSNSTTWNGTSFASGTNTVHPTTYNNGTGLWTYTFASGSFPADGIYSVAVNATDAAGNASTTSTNTFTYDNTAPVVTLTKLNGAPQTFPYYTNAAVTSIGGACGTASGDSATVNWSVTGGATESGSTSCSSGSWSATLPTQLSAEGGYTVSATQPDTAGNTGSSGNQSIVIDETAPSPTLNSFTNNATKSTTPTFTGTAGNQAADSSDSADSNTVTVYVCSGTQASCGASGPSLVETRTATRIGTTWSIAATALTANATYTAQAAQSDGAGNTGSSGAITFVVDTIAPTVTSVGTTTATGAYKAGVTISITVTFSEPVTVTGTPKLTLNTSPSKKASYTSGSGTSTLTFTYTIAAGDTASQLDYASTSALTGGTIQDAATNNAVLTLPATQSANDTLYATDIVVDTTAPVVTLTQVNGSTQTFPYSTNVNVTTVGGACGSLSGDSSTINVTVIGTASQSGTATCTSNAWTYTMSPTLAAAGSYTVTATQSDTAGNTGTSTGTSIKIDKTAPVVTLTKVNGSTQTFPHSTNVNVTTVGGACGSVSGDSSTINVTVTGTASQSGTATCASNAWTYTMSPALSIEGTYTVTATQSDAAGNTGTSTGKSITKTTPGAPTSVSLANGGGQGSSYINIANQSSVSVTVGVAENISTDTVKVTISDGTHQATGSAAVTGSTVTVTGINASALNDGTGNVTIAATESDSGGNTSGSTPAATTYSKDTVAPTVTGLASANTTGGTSGQAEQGDSITLTFSEPILASSIPSSSNVVLDTANGSSKPVTLGLSGLDSAPFTIGTTPGYLAKNSADVDFNGSAVSEPAGNQITLTLGTQSGSGTTTVGSSQSVTFPVSSSLTDVAGNPATGSFTTTILFF